ncbi:MAG: hypothetical protein PHW53_04675 [Patescibacteria group bacterium]|nr:hypothetical protein [Patescibacteria group bacterium]
MIIGAKDNATPTLEGIMKSIKNIGLAYLSWSAVSSAVKSVVNAAAESEAAWNRVEASLKRHNYAVKGNIDAIKNFATEMQRTRGISDELVGEGIQRLIDAGNSLTQSFNISRVAADLAAGTNMDYYSAVELLTKASEGFTSTLSRYGIVLDESIPKSQRFQMALEQINRKFGGAAQAEMNTYAGQVKILEQNWDDLKESIGEQLIPELLLLVKQFNLVMDTIDRTGGGIWNFIKAIGVITQGTDLDRRLIEMSNAAWKLGEQLRIAHEQADADFSKRFKEATDAEYQYELAIDRLMAALKARNDAMIIASRGVGHTVSEITVQVRDDTKSLTREASNYFDNYKLEVIDGGREIDAAQNIYHDYERQRIREDDIAWQEANQHKIAAMGYFQSEFSSSMADMMMGSSVNFQKMHKDFMRYFIKACIEDMIKGFVPKFLSILGNLFDNPINDRMAAGQGKDFAKHFAAGVTGELSRVNLGGKIGSTISGELMTGKRNVQFN